MGGMKKLLLFDLDGTLLLTGGAGVKGMEEAGVGLFGEAFSLKPVRVAGGLDPLIYAEATRLAGVENAHEHHDRFRDHYLEILHRNMVDEAYRKQVLPGILELLSKLRKDPRVVLGLVTGNYTAAVPIKLRAVGIDPAWFSINAFGDEAPDRPGLVRLARDRFCARYGREIACGDTIVIGDTPQDVHCAHANGCICLAVATGMYSFEQLQEAGADVVVRDLGDPGPLMELIEAAIAE